MLIKEVPQLDKNSTSALASHSCLQDEQPDACWLPVLISLLPRDRTSWDYGQTPLNLLVFCVVLKRFTLPLIWVAFLHGGWSSATRKVRPNLPGTPKHFKWVTLRSDDAAGLDLRPRTPPGSASSQHLSAGSVRIDVALALFADIPGLYPSAMTQTNETTVPVHDPDQGEQRVIFELLPGINLLDLAGPAQVFDVARMYGVTCRLDGHVPGKDSAEAHDS